MDIKYFEKWDLLEEDFKIDTYRGLIMDGDYRHGVTIGIKPYNISVSCHSKTSQVKNKEECLKLLDVILTNYTL